MGELASWLWSQIKAALNWFADVFKEVFVAGWNVLTDLVCWIVEKFMDLAISAVSSLPLGGITQYTGVMGEIPSEVMNVLGLLGVGPAITIITAAIGIRLVLQLIPFVRLGS